MTDKKVYYMVFEKPIDSKCWTRADDSKVSKFCRNSCNIFRLLDSAKEVIRKMNTEDDKGYHYCLFKCEEM